MENSNPIEQMKGFAEKKLFFEYRIHRAACYRSRNSTNSRTARME